MKITEITRQGAELDTIAKIKAEYPNWEPGMPHPVTNEPTFKQNNVIKTTGKRRFRLPFQKQFSTGAGDPIPFDDLDPRYDDQTRKSVNQAYKDKFKDIDPSDFRFSKSATGYLTAQEWDYKYGLTHNPDGSPKKIDPQDDANNPKNPRATRNKNISTGLSADDIKDLDKNIVIFNFPGKFDPWSGISSQQKSENETGKFDKSQNLFQELKTNSHKLYGYVDAYSKDKDVIVLDDSNFDPITFSTKLDNIEDYKKEYDKLEPGSSKLPNSSGLSNRYVSKLQRYYNKLYKYYKPYIQYIQKHEQNMKMYNSKEFQNYWRKHSGAGILGKSEFRDEKNLTSDQRNQLQKINPWYSEQDPTGSKKIAIFSNMPKQNILSTEFWNEYADDPDEARRLIEISKNYYNELNQPKVRIPRNEDEAFRLNKSLTDLGMDPETKKVTTKNVKSRAQEDTSGPLKDTGLKLLQIDISANPKKDSNESKIMQSIKLSINEEFKTLKTELNNLRIRNNVVQIVNPEFEPDEEKQSRVPPRPAEDDASDKGGFRGLEKNKGIDSDRFAQSTKNNFKKMYGKDVDNVGSWFDGNNFLVTGLSENEPGNQPKSNKSVNNEKRFLGVISKDSVLYIFDKKSKQWYPSQNDLLYARAVERLTNSKIIDDAEDSWKRSQSLGQLLKGIKRDFPKWAKDTFGNPNKPGKPFDPGKTSSRFDR